MQISTPYWIEAASYLASALVFTAFFMKAIVPLRSISIVSNVVFVVYALGSGNIPMLLLHVSLFPLNIIRVVQYIRLVRRVREAVEGDLDVEKLLPFMESRQLSKDAIIFRKGDRAEDMYYLSHGHVRFLEIDATIGPGTIFGEIALFLDERGRTATAVCLDDCELFSLSESKVQELAVLDPTFGLVLTKLIAVRMNENIAATRKA